MVAQIDAAGAAAEEADTHRLLRQDSRRQQPRQHPSEIRTRPQRIGEQAADDAAVDGPSQRIDDARRRGVVGNDVEQQVHVVVRHVDVGDQAVDRPVVVGEDLRGVAAQYRKPPEVFGQRHRMIERRAELRMEDVRVAAEPLVDRLGKLHELDVTLQAPGRRRRPADEQIQRDADRRLEKDQQQPALGRFRRAPEWHDDDHRDAHRPFGGKKNVDPEGLVGEKRGHVVIASRIAPR